MALAVIEWWRETDPLFLIPGMPYLATAGPATTACGRTPLEAIWGALGQAAQNLPVPKQVYRVDKT